MHFPKRCFASLAVATLFFFTWTTVRPWSLAAAAQAAPASPARPSNNVKSAPEKFEDSLRAAKRLLERLDQEAAEGKDASETLDDLRKHRQVIEAADTDIRAEFGATEAQLKKAGLPPEILERHRNAVSEYEANYQRLLENLGAVERLDQERKDAEGKKDHVSAEAKLDELKARGKEARDHLEQTVKEPAHTPLDPNNLPHRTPKPNQQKPRLKKEQFSVPTRSSSLNREEPIRLAAVGHLSGLFAMSAADLPTDADLAQTIEVQFTQEIYDLATQLGRNPVQIYNWVRNNIDFVPTYGSIQGAQMCLLTKRCNDMDTASLLIALLRTSGIAARYVVGTIEVPIDRIMNWIGGFTDPQSALNFIASSGTPVAGVIAGGKIAAAQLEHVWVEAFVDYIPSRGAVHKEGDTWIPLDASFKQFTFTPGTDLQAAVPFDVDAFTQQLQSTATINEQEGFVAGLDGSFIQREMADHVNRVVNYLHTNLPNATIDDLIGKKSITTQQLPVLSATLPYTTLVTGNRLGDLGDALRHKLTFEVASSVFFGADVTFTASLPELTGKRITLSYVPATAADQQTIQSFGGLYETPAYLIKVKPQLKVQGVIEAEGKAVGMGVLQKFTMAFMLPNHGPDRVQNDIIAGGYYAVGLFPDRLPSRYLAVLQKRAQQLSDFGDGGGDRGSDEGLGEQLYLSAMTYFWEVDRLTDAFASQAHVIYAKQPGEGIFGLALAVRTLFLVPRTVTVVGTNIDVDRVIYLPFPTAGDQQAPKNFMTAAGISGSTMEGKIMSQLYEVDGVSAAHAMHLANSQGLKLYRITSSNLATVLPLLQVSTLVKTDIINAINAGKEVTIPEKELQVNDWGGIGYIVSDPATGAAAYLISGGIAGGASTQGLGLPDIKDLQDLARRAVICIDLLLVQILVTLTIAFQLISTGVFWYVVAGVILIVIVIAFILLCALSIRASSRYRPYEYAGLKSHSAFVLSHSTVFVDFNFRREPLWI